MVFDGSGWTTPDSLVGCSGHVHRLDGYRMVDLHRPGHHAERGGRLRRHLQRCIWDQLGPGSLVSLLPLSHQFALIRQALSTRDHAAGVPCKRRLVVYRHGEVLSWA